ncbi:MAG TPA: NAD(P)H-dependent oxidoreductase [Candidatus Thermoplasmatota archaeon]|nr:NAD(P)H-dependent oxidoreductase [Candidatus Thermoplasmatota archaeon]
MSSQQPEVHVLGVVGSLRKGSYHRSLLRAAQELSPVGMTITIFDLTEIPLFNEDVEARGDPGPVKALKDAIQQADAILISSPEYCYSVSGVLKNALDWASRPVDSSVLDGKPVAIMGGSTGNYGTTRGQMVLRQTLMYANMLPVSDPQVAVPHVDEKIDDGGRLTDESTRKYIQQLLEALREWTLRLRPCKSMLVEP